MKVFNLTPFVDLCPEMAKSEAAYLSCVNHPSIEDGKYLLFEMYCAEPACDCRQVMILVLGDAQAVGQSDVLAAFTFGWESSAFYKKWLRQVPHAPEAETDLWSGAHLLPDTSPSASADAFLAAFRLFIRHPSNVQRYRRHYQLFRHENAARQTRTRSAP